MLRVNVNPRRSRDTLSAVLAPSRDWHLNATQLSYRTGTIAAPQPRTLSRIHKLVHPAAIRASQQPYSLAQSACNSDRHSATSEITSVIHQRVTIINSIPSTFSFTIGGERFSLIRRPSNRIMCKCRAFTERRQSIN